MEACKQAKARNSLSKVSLQFLRHFIYKIKFKCTYESMISLILEFICYQITKMFGLSEGAVIWSLLMCVMQRKLGKKGASQDDSV